MSRHANLAAAPFVIAVSWRLTAALISVEILVLMLSLNDLQIVGRRLDGANVEISRYSNWLRVNGIIM